MKLEQPSKLSPSSESSIIIVAEDDDEYSGFVVAVGPGFTRDDGVLEVPPFKKGDHIVFRKEGGIDVELMTEPHRLIRPIDVLARLEAAS